ncbi:hypothetical protein ONS95_014850 [Cadophora gregata]|uniref:uncharacterized protein n=1 Tax=Cadophora gregata TaxID=51156 RepID=UPI0026DC8E00|nr:uncharacterized protein ONS95_014850 [Cadophora gregata]KAK0113151.1 hypothetical protein ONS95_014850 [Cadophora gregata]KAK0125192.1 hypothetical protein ONS96_009051 [Cadophora gregata f. sp. sojae]
MSAPRRRSSRLRPPKALNNASDHLESLAERNETPVSGSQSNLVAVASSPLPPRTPATAGRIKPPLSEMHPSKAHQSTTQEPDSGLRLGFTDIDTGNKTNQPSGLTQQTPTKAGISSPAFDFRFARPGPQLGPEAQRMMDELREEALRIKAKLAAAREEEKRKEVGSDGGTIRGRKFAQPKGKAGRFSDAHMAEFRKMDSIAGHPSSFRAHPGRGRTTPVSNSLKRTQSKAQLDNWEQVHKKNEQVTENVSHSEQLESMAPFKRARKHVSEDTSTARPVSRSDSKAVVSTPTVLRSQSSIITTVTTPTRTSSVQVASTKKTHLPTISRSPSKPNLSIAGMPRALTNSATTINYSSIARSDTQSSIRSPGKFDRVKSILRHPSFGARKPITKSSSIPSLTRSPSRPNLEKPLPSIPSTPGVNVGKTARHLTFTLDTVHKDSALVPHSPSPIKSGIPRSASKVNFDSRRQIKPTSGAKSDATEIEYPSIACLPKLGESSNTVEYPSLAGVRPHPEPPRQVEPPSVPGTFTFRSDHTIRFESSPKDFGSSPGQASLRQVRPSVLPNVMPGSLPSGDKENAAPIPSVPHGMANKKRRRVESDDEAEDEIDRSPKKTKTVAEGHMLLAPKLQTTAKTKTPSPVKKKGVLSLSRLNMLARPKMRK